MTSGASPAVDTVGGWLTWLSRRFAAVGIDTPDLDARLLLAAALDMSPTRLRLERDRAVGAEVAGTVMAWADRRAGREPVSRILGRRGFWSLDLTVTPDTLDPRPDTETVVEAVLRAKPNGAARVLDLGTGTGCLLLALLAEWPSAVGVGVDMSAGALVAARRNALNADVAARARFVRADWTAALRGEFDVIVSNPPYLTANDMACLEPEVRHDPALALAGGEDGLDAYRILIPGAAGLLARDGVVAVEIGVGMGDAVVDIMREAGLGRTEVHQDLAGIVRCIVSRRS